MGLWTFQELNPFHPAGFVRVCVFSFTVLHPKGGSSYQLLANILFSFHMARPNQQKSINTFSSSTCGWISQEERGAHQHLLLFHHHDLVLVDEQQRAHSCFLCYCPPPLLSLSTLLRNDYLTSWNPSSDEIIFMYSSNLHGHGSSFVFKIKIYLY